MKILCIIHADFETPGVIEAWATQRGHSFTICKPYQGEDCLDTPFNMLIVMGGPQSPLSMEEAPYLADEIFLIQCALAAGKPILGFCLGAQLIGEALGAKTEKSPEKEIGVYPITLTKEAFYDPLLEGFPENMDVIHWHNDMPGLTEESIVLATSAGCPRQIIRYATHVYGFQCHLEITPSGIATMIEHCVDDLKPSQFTQDKVTLLQNNYEAINALMMQILDRFSQNLGIVKKSATLH